MCETKLSIILPAWNRKTVIRRAIASIRGDSQRPFELIVVDDGSTDGTGAVAEAAIAEMGLNGRVISQANAGPAAARNTGVANASGEYLAFLDSDDYWLPWTLQLCLDELDRTDRPAPILMFFQTVDTRPDAPAGGAWAGPPRIENFGSFLEAVDAVGTTRYATCNAVMSRKAFDALGGFTTAAEPSEDTDLFMRAARLGPCVLIVGLALVIHELGRADNISAAFAKVAKGFDFIMTENVRGRYPDAPTGPLLKDRMLAKIVVNTILVAFASGHPLEAYRLLFLHCRRLLRGRDWHWLVRLPILPALSWLKPESFRIRWRAS